MSKKDYNAKFQPSGNSKELSKYSIYDMVLFYPLSLPLPPPGAASGHGWNVTLSVRHAATLSATTFAVATVTVAPVTVAPGPLRERVRG